jgi:hypothetical protein
VGGHRLSAVVTECVLHHWKREQPEILAAPFGNAQRTEGQFRRCASLRLLIPPPNLASSYGSYSSSEFPIARHREEIRRNYDALHLYRNGWVLGTD